MEFGNDGGSSMELARRWVYGAKVDEPLGFEDYTSTTVAGTGTFYEVYADRQGSVTDVIDPATGTVAAHYSYDSFGNRITTGTLIQPYGFTSREVDEESGLMYYRARHYDPILGQFIQRDPIGFNAGDLNLYAYVWNELRAEFEEAGFVTGVTMGQELINARKVEINITDNDKITVYADGDIGIFVNDKMFCRHLSENLEWKLVQKNLL